MIWKLAKRVTGGRLPPSASSQATMLVHGWAEATTLAPSACSADWLRPWSGAGAALLVSVHSSQ
jgi:hypothetical protein